MKILMLTCQYMPDVFGGAEKQCGRVSKGIQANGHEVKVLTSRQKLKWKNKEVVNDVKVERLYSPIAPDLLGRWLPFSIYWLLRVIIWGVIHRKEFDIIHCHQGKFGAFVGCCLARLFNKKILIKVGNSNQFMDFTALKAKKIIGPILANFVLKTDPVVVAISGVIAQNCKDFGFKRIVNIANSIDTSLAEKSSPERAQAERKEGVINLFYHGRLEEIKKVDVLLESFDLLYQEHKNIHFHLIGSGSVLADAKLYLASKKLTAHVTCYGEVKEPVKFIQQFDIFVNASEAEGFSNSLLEALLTGKVLVSTPVSGASDAICDGKNGYICSDFSAQSIKSAVVKSFKLFLEEQESVAEFSKQLVDEHFKLEVIADKYSKLYKQIMEDRV